MKIMSDDDATLDSMDTEEDIFNPHSDSVRRAKSLRTLRSHSHSTSSHMTRNNLSVRRSTRNRMQTYDNLNTSWILGTQTLKGYPMFQQHGSSSDKEMVDEVPDRKRDLRDRMPLRSRENHPPNKNSSRHIRDRSDHDHQNSRELRGRSDRDLREKSEQEKDIREHKDRQGREKQDREHKDKLETRNKSEVRTSNEEKETRTSKSNSPCRLREGPVTRLCGNSLDKTVKSKVEQDEAEDSSHESEKQENNDNSENEDGYEDMYTRIKRTRRTTQRQLPRGKKLTVVDSDLSESSDSPGPRKYSLRQKKPTVDRFQANVEPVRRSIRALRSVLSNSMRRRKHRSKSTSSSDSSDSEPQRYDKKKGKKARQSAIPQGGPPDRKADINPITLDTNIRFSDVGGLESHIHCLKEMVVFPMMYPEVFERYHITPPKGVLFHGPPGTGKTLIARALANECSQGSRKMAFFMRKGADCLSKWVGESERQLRLLFEQAQQMKPSIIFFDEIDGLAPVRSTKQDQIHASIVSTLLALMDGLSDRGEVIVIGATNRIDAIDPALRRPGRFDRELFFPLPAMKERLEILKIHVNKWENPPTEQLLEILAEKATGYCGSDLRALCTEAVLQGLRRTYPQIYMTSNRLLLDPRQVEVKKQDFMQASSTLIPSSQRVTPCAGRKLQPFMEPLLGPPLEELIGLVKGIFPQGVNPAMAKVKVTKGIHRPRLLVSGGNLSKGQGPHLAQALLHHMEHLPVQTLDVSTLFAESARSPEETCVQVFNEATRNVPSIIYIRSIDQWWPLVPETVKAVFLCRIAALDTSLPILILATSDETYQDLPMQLKNLFSELRGEVYTMKIPNSEQRSKFFKPIFTVQSLRQPQIKDNKVQVLEELPLAPDPMPKKLSDEEKKMLYEKEEVSLRELRIFLREICAKLARNRQFFMFTKPVDTEEVPDYNMIIKQPMDLETMMTKIDMHCYLCARDFLDDIDLICRNALEYNPDSLRDRPSLGILKRDPADKLIRHRACSLRDNAYALIKAELDSDFEDKCREISKNRKIIETNHNDEMQNKITKTELTLSNEKNDKKDPELVVNNTLSVNGKRFSQSRKRKIPAWARGYVKKVQKKKKISFDGNISEINSKVCLTNEPSVGIDLEKFQEFETEANSVLNGHVPLYDNTDSENDSQNENSKDIQINHNDNMIEQRIDDFENVEICFIEDDKNIGNDVSSSSSRRESLDELSFAIESDSSPSKVDENDKVIIDKNELETAWLHTVDVTKDFSVEVLCDIYVQLSRCVGRYAHHYDRKSLPKYEKKKRERRRRRRGSFSYTNSSIFTNMLATKDFSNIGGLDKHIRIVKEMVLFPLMYGDVYAKFNLKPPRGLLFYGPPGTGKTLVASALASECSTSERKVSFISRKGSDCLSKWVGESEKKLEKIFNMAQQTKPCIIFFDEVDGLAPIRTSRQDFVHASVVSTLLALMDGLENNSEIIVIGATNRIDAIDPALRRPGRFDRELYFPLPSYSARKDILSVHIKSWKHKPPQKFLAYLASRTVGYCGSDLQALCAEAVMCCVRRHYPEIYTSKSRRYINERHLKVEKQDFLKAQENIVPASHRVVIAPVKSLSIRIQPLLRDHLSTIQSQLQILCPTGMLTSDDIVGKANSRSTACPRILLCGEDDSHTRHLGPALLHELDHLPCHVLDVTTLFEETGRAAEETIIQKVKAARRTLPSLLYIPDILSWWNLVDETARVVFASLMRDLDNTVYMLILATANSSYENLPSEVKNSFDQNQNEVFKVSLPGLQERQSFFLQLFSNSTSDAVSSRSSQDFIQIMDPKKTKVEHGKKLKMDSLKDFNGQRGRHHTVDGSTTKKSKPRNKLAAVRSTQSATRSINIKRECSASGEGPAPKRSRMSRTPSNISSAEGVMDPQLQGLFQRIIESTENWTSNQLENLYGSLEHILERKNENDNMSNIIQNCLLILEESKKRKIFFDYEDD